MFYHPLHFVELINRLALSSFGDSKKSFGVFSSTTTPLSMKITFVPTFFAKFISWVTTSIAIPSPASFLITSNTSPISSGSRAEVGSSNRITSGSVAISAAHGGAGLRIHKEGVVGGAVGANGVA